MLSERDYKIIKKYNKLNLNEDEKRLIVECKNYPPDLDEIKRLLDKGIDPNLFYGRGFGDEVNLKDIYDIQESEGNKSIYYYSLLTDVVTDYALEEDQNEDWDRYFLEIVKLLLEHGADPDIDFNDEYPLFEMKYAHKRNHKIAIEVAKILLDHGADPLKTSWDDTITLYEYVQLDDDPVDYEYDSFFFDLLYHTEASIIGQIDDLRYGTKLFKLYKEGLLGYDQLQIAAHMCACEYKNHSERLEQYEAAEKKSLEIISAIKRCQSDEAVTAVLGMDDGADFICDGNTLISYSGSKKDVVIPFTITRIGPDAFWGNKQLESVFIHDSVTNVERRSFANCTRLKHVHIGSSINVIQDRVFAGCTALEEITIPRNIKSINCGSFKGCFSLKKVIIYDGLRKISVGAFCKCYSLSRIDLPETVSKIGRYAFSKCRKLTKVDIRSKDIEISAKAFYKCPENLSFIWRCRRPFEECAGNGFDVNEEGTLVNYFGTMKNVVVSLGVKAIGRYAFAGRNDIISVSLPETVKEIGDSAFAYTYGLETISMPNVERVEKYAFWASGLKEAHFPETLWRAGQDIFGNCDNLTIISFDSEDVWFNGRIAPMCSNLEEVVLPKKQTFIPPLAFYYCRRLKSLSIPETVKQIGEDAFVGCEIIEKP